VAFSGRWRWAHSFSGGGRLRADFFFLSSPAWRRFTRRPGGKTGGCPVFFPPFPFPFFSIGRRVPYGYGRHHGFSYPPPSPPPPPPFSPITHCDIPNEWELSACPSLSFPLPLLFPFVSTGRDHAYRRTLAFLPPFFPSLPPPQRRHHGMTDLSFVPFPFPPPPFQDDPRN